jgi:hypothetical protein
VKRWIAAAACVLAGFAAGAIWTLVQGDRYRADARVLVRPASNRIVPAVEALAESSLVESNVGQTLHLSSPPRLSAKAGKGGVLTVSVEAGSPERARQIDAEAVVVLTQTVAHRFGTANVTATALDPAHAAEQTSPTAGRNFLIAGLIGLATGLAAATLTRGRAAAESGGDSDAEHRLTSRIEAVAKRERALARRAGELAAREKRLRQREEEHVAFAAQAAPSSGELPEPDPVVPPETPDQEPELAVPSEPPGRQPETPAPPEPGPRGWTLTAVERLLQEETDADPARYEEWRTYLYLLREHADYDGTLPSSFQALVADVFGELIKGRAPESG